MLADVTASSACVQRVCKSTINVYTSNECFVCKCNCAAMQTYVRVRLFAYLQCTPHFYHTWPIVFRSVCVSAWEMGLAIVYCVLCMNMVWIEGLHVVVNPRFVTSVYGRHNYAWAYASSTSVCAKRKWKSESGQRQVWLCVCVCLQSLEVSEVKFLNWNRLGCIVHTFATIVGIRSLSINTSLSNQTAPAVPVNLYWCPSFLPKCITGDGNGHGGGSSVRCCTIRLVPFPLIGLTPSHLACDTSNAGAFLRHLIDQNKHIILW